MKRFIILLLLLAALGGGAWWKYRADGARAEPVASVAAVVGDIEDTVLATGTLQPLRQVGVGAQVSGRVVSLKVAVGQRVESGALVAEIDGVTLQNALRNALAAVNGLKAQRDEKLANLRYAEASLARQKLMVGQNAVSRDAYEVAETSVLTTRAQIAALDAQIEQGQVQVDTARANLDYTRITAPMAGTVLGIVTQEGQTVNANQSAPTIVVMGEVDTMIVKAKISEADVVRVKPGQEVYFTILGEPEKRRRARLVSIEPAPESIKTENATSSSSASASASSSASNSAIYYNALFDVPNADGALLTSMTAQVTVVVSRARGAVTVPSVAVRRDSQGTMVDVVEADGTVTPRRVRVGLDNRISVAIEDGLAAGERVAIGRRTGQPTAQQSRRRPASMF